jgi:hypothetical protein
VVCARCVEKHTYDENITHATQGEGSSNSDATWQQLLNKVTSHYATQHTTSPSHIEPGASLVSGTTISGNTAFHSGNESNITVTNTQVGTLSDGEFLQNSGGSLAGAVAQGAFSNIDVFEADGTFDASSVDFAFVQVVGGGGGGEEGVTNGFNAGPGGCGGGFSAGYVDLSSNSSVTVTVGAGGSPRSSGETSSFGSFLSATGGDAGDNGAFNVPSFSGGSGSGGSINITGGDGGQAMRDDSGNSEVIGGDGGDSVLGTGGTGGGASNNSVANPGTKFGGGGGGGGANNTGGAAGAQGVVIVRH